MYELHCGDALQFMATLPDSSIDAIITDLPYGTTACAWDEVIPFAPMWEQVKRMLKPRGVFVTTASQPFTSKLVMSNLEWFKYCLVWHKSRPSGFLDANRRPLNDVEDICVFGSGAHTYNPQMTKGAPNHVRHGAMREFKKAEQYNEYGVTPDVRTEEKYPRRVLKIDSLNAANGMHPTQKPAALYAYLIRTYTNPGDTVLDFCCGSGTTGVACIKEGRNFIGCDSDEGYHAIATKRLADASAQLALPFDL